MADCRNPSATNLTGMRYRAEIDGLRAIAIIPVILYHAGYSWISGGFVGVDIFFVVSGYLITSIILKDLRAGSFSIVSFYERRARRIIPGLFFVIACSIPLAWMWLMPSDLRDFGQSLIASATFSSNILFWRESGYFDSSAELKPLLHTWSLSVEEQYYVLFPASMILLWRLGATTTTLAISAITLISLAFAHAMSVRAPDAAFYLLPTRIWELLVGSLLAIFLIDRDTRMTNQMVNQILSATGLLLIGIAVFGFDATTPYPSLYTLAPTLGAGLLILSAREGTLAYLFLRHPLMIGIGLISYSAYLWHQPLFTFARHRNLTLDPLLLNTALIALTLLLSYLTWRFVEAPFRNRNYLSQRSIFSITLGALFAFLGVGIFLQQQAFAISNLPNYQTSNRMFLHQSCDLADFQSTECRLLGTADVKPTILLWGDSHAQSLEAELHEKLIEKGVSAYSITRPGCTPIPKVAPNTIEFTACTEITDRVLASLEQLGDIETVILSARWTAPYVGSTFDNGEGGVEKVNRDSARLQYDSGESYSFSQEKIKDQYQYLLTKLSDRTVVTILPVPETGWNVPRLFTTAILDGVLDISNVPEAFGSTSYERFVERNAEVESMLTESPVQLKVIKPSKLFCNTVEENRCIVHREGELLYTDNNHVSDAGAELIVEELAKEVL